MVDWGIVLKLTMDNADSVEAVNTLTEQLGGTTLSMRGNLARARARGAGAPRTVEHRFLSGLGCYKTLMMRAKE